MRKSYDMKITDVIIAERKKEKSTTVANPDTPADKGEENAKL